MVASTSPLFSQIICWNLIIFYITNKSSTYHVGQIWKEWSNIACFHVNSSYFLTNSAEKSYSIFLVVIYGTYSCALKWFPLDQSSSS